MRNPLSPARSDEQGDGFMVVERKKKRRIKPTINIVGDSMAQNVTKLIKFEEEGSGCVSLQGAGMKQIMKSVSQNVCDMKRFANCPGWGQEPQCIGSKQNSRVYSGDYATSQKKNNRYETMRNSVNKMIQKQVCALKLTLLKKRMCHIWI